MIVICEKCGKKYRIDSSKIKGKEAFFKCKSCNHVNELTKKISEDKDKEVPVTQIAPTPPTISDKPSSIESDTKELTFSAKPASELETQPQPESLEKEETPKSPKKEKPTTYQKHRGVGLWFKMLILFLIIPIVIIGIASYLYLQQLNKLSDLLIEESTGLVSEMSESIIAENSWFASSQANLYLEAHPDLEKEYFNNDSAFKRLIQKKIGLTGYTYLFSLSDGNNPSILWLHPNDGIIGQPLKEVMQKELGRNYKEFTKILNKIEKGNVFEANGYFAQKDQEGKIRQKYIYVTPVEGTDFALAATTYIDEFTLPVLNLEKSARRTTKQIQNYILAILIGMLILVGLFVIIYSHRLSGKIKSLTDAANRISVGELDEEIQVKSSDEIGDLADAISRMQESIRLSIERLRRRR